MSDVNSTTPPPAPSPEDTADSDLLLEKIVQEHLTRAPVAEVTTPFRSDPAEAPSAGSASAMPSDPEDNNLESAIAALLGTVETPPATKEVSETPILPVDQGLSGAEMDSLLAPVAEANAPPAAEPVVSPPKVSAPFAATEPPEPIEISQEAFVATEETVADGVIIKSPAGKAEPVAAQAVAAAAVVEPEAPKAGEKPVAVAAAVEAAPKKAPDAVAAAVVGAGGESKDGQPVTAEEAAGLLPTEEGAAPAVMVKRKPRFFHDLALMVAQLMDMPFAALGQDAKQCIGVAGVIFLGTGVVLMVLSHMHR